MIGKMEFRKLAEFWEKLEKVSGRLKMTRLLAELFVSAKQNEIDKVVYLSLGQLGPKHSMTEFNVAEKMMVRVLAQAYEVEVDEVKRAYKKEGDLGLVAGSLAENKKKKVEILRQPQTSHGLRSAQDDKDDFNRLSSLSNVKGQMSVNEAYRRLMEIALDEGRGSQERKVKGLADLLRSVDKVSAKYIARIPVGKLRLGFGEMTILDGLSWMVTGDKSLHEELEDAYNVAADVGLIAKQVRSRVAKILRQPQTPHGLGSAQDDRADLKSLSALSSEITRALGKVKVRLGTPVVAELCQRLKSFDEILEKMGEVAVEPKYDGTRLQIHWRRRAGKREDSWQVRSFTRNLEENSYMFPELHTIADQLDRGMQEAIFDCEAIGVDPKTGKWLPFQVTMTRKRKYAVEEQRGKVPLKFMCFDILYVKEAKGRDGDVHGLPLSDRRKLLEKVIKKGKVLEIVPQLVTKDANQCRNLHKKYLKTGLEGVIIKRWGSPYVPGRKGWNWVKMKEVEEAKAGLADTLDCVVMGYYRGRGQRAKFGLGAFLVGVRGNEDRTIKRKDGKLKSGYLTVSKIGTGLTDEQFGDLQGRLKKLEVEKQPKEYEVNKNLQPDVWVRPELVVEIAADNITKSKVHTSDYGLRFPRLVKFRDDKGAEQASTLEEVVRLFELQK